jgi:hypothetical protein
VTKIEYLDSTTVRLERFAEMDGTKRTTVVSTADWTILSDEKVH